MFFKKFREAVIKKAIQAELEKKRKEFEGSPVAPYINGLSWIGGLLFSIAEYIRDNPPPGKESDSK